MRYSTAIFILIALAVIGCGNSNSGGSGTDLSGSGNTPLVKPFSGRWTFDLNKTLAQWKTDGVSIQEINQARALAQTYPLHPDINVASQSITTHGVIEGEYHFFSLHQHNQWVCGKAWHHEDRHDPGDMSKCYIRLEIVNGDLHLSVRMTDTPLNLNDPDLTNMPATGGSTTNCQADAATTPPWSQWTTYIFVQEPSDES